MLWLSHELHLIILLLLSLEMKITKFECLFRHVLYLQRGIFICNSERKLLGNGCRCMDLVFLHSLLLFVEVIDHTLQVAEGTRTHVLILCKVQHGFRDLGGDIKKYFAIFEFVFILLTSHLAEV